MEDYLCKNVDISPAPMFEFVHWDITLVKDPGGRALGLSLNIEIPVTAVYKPGFGIVFTKPLPVCLFQKHVR
ncbi:hypothetical protein SESBI_23078 [Sesbania bispinosa]|nr:hypothetical protein SESBI_23078 [Sesbania bispinosa]